MVGEIVSFVCVSECVYPFVLKCVVQEQLACYTPAICSLCVRSSKPWLPISLYGVFFVYSKYFLTWTKKRRIQSLSFSYFLCGHSWVSSDTGFFYAGAYGDENSTDVFCKQSHCCIYYLRPPLSGESKYIYLCRIYLINSMFRRYLLIKQLSR